MRISRKNYLSVLILTFIICPLFNFGQMGRAKKKADKDTQSWRYEIEGVSQGVQGTYLIKVWSFSKRNKVAIEQAKKNAVHGVIFRGYQGSKKGVRPQKPLTKESNLEQEKEMFFNEFFANGGKYMKFVSLTNNGAVSPGDRQKLGRFLAREHKIGIMVSVKKDLLRKDLEDAGIIRGLNSGF